MKTNLLKMRRVLSATLLVLLLNVVGMTNAFGQTQVATLQHNDTISMYYGQNALVEAYNACADGDIITLSSGTFTACTIYKTITLRGAGCVADTTTNTLPTIIPGTMAMGYQCSPTIEGVLFNGNVVYCNYSTSMSFKPTFIKCDINSITYDSYFPSNRNFQFTNCIIKSFNFRYLVECTVVNNILIIADYYAVICNYVFNIFTIRKNQ